VVVVGIKTKAALFPQAARAVVGLVLHLPPMRLLERQILAVAVVAVMGQMALAQQAAQVLSSSPTQAQHKNSVVELLPNQAVTSFTHSHLLAHLALCHL
jgi:hypothetical protein